MRVFRYLAAIILLSALSLVTTLRPAPAAAATPRIEDFGTSLVHPFSVGTLPEPAYDIQSLNDYCQGGGSACVLSTDSSGISDCINLAIQCPGFSFADVEFYGPDTGATSGTPYEIYAECNNVNAAGEASAYIDLVSPAGAAAYGTGVYGQSDTGAIGGNAALLDWYQFSPIWDPSYPEGNTSQVSSGSVSAYDPVASLRASITGIQNTDNSADSLNSGSFRITITGMIDYAPFNGAPYERYGTVSCTAGGPHANDIYATQTGYSPYEEGELEYELGTDV